MSVLIARFSNKRDARTAATNARKNKGSVQLVEDNDWEDFVLGKLIDEAEKEGGEIPVEKILTKLSKNGSNRKKRI